MRSHWKLRPGPQSRKNSEQQGKRYRANTASSNAGATWQTQPQQRARQAHLRRHMMTPPHQRFPPSRISPHDAPRTERDFLSAQRRPGLPRGQFSGPWLFSAAEARTGNSQSSWCIWRWGRRQKSENIVVSARGARTWTAEAPSRAEISPV